MSVYFAARFSRREELQGYAEELTGCGLLVTSRWLNSPAKLGAEELSRHRRGGEVARMDLEDVVRADVCVAFTEERDANERGRGGRHTELGIALGLGRAVVVVGPPEHVFHCLPEVIHHTDWRSASAWLCQRASMRPAA